jgi:hypothetical protein
MKYRARGPLAVIRDTNCELDNAVVYIDAVCSEAKPNLNFVLFAKGCVPQSSDERKK